MCVYCRIMQIRLISVGTRMPVWVQQGFREYQKRMPRDYDLVLIEIPAGRRTRNSDLDRIVEEEGERIMAALPEKTHAVVLDMAGKAWTTEQLAQAMLRWRENSRHVALMVGGPDGLSSQVKLQAHESWSLSSMTLPHPLVRIVVAEQLYRAWTILVHHPYHR